MQCSGCTGMRVPEIICEGGTRIMALRCIHCGDIVDRVIARNRERRQHSHPRQPRTPVYRNSPSGQKQLIWVYRSGSWPAADNTVHVLWQEGSIKSPM